MKILIHGATNGSNFGDCLFAHLFYKKMSNYGEVDFLKSRYWGLSNYLKNEISDYKQKNININNADAFIFMSGGYFGDTNGSLNESVKRYFRYFRYADILMRKKKKIYILGVGGGPIKNKWLRNKIVKLINYSELITVRDEETANYFLENGVNRNILITTDSALSIIDEKLPQLPDNLIHNIKNKKNIFFHVYGDDNHNVELEEKILPALNKFVEKNSSYQVLVGTDNKCKNKIEDLKIYKRLIGRKIPLEYHSTWELCSILNNVDLIITVKLHVGIIGSVYNKSVISLAKHKNKTRRFYKQINQVDRCKQLSDINAEQIFEMLNKYASKPIKIDKNLFEVSKQNFIIK